MAEITIPWEPQPRQLKFLRACGLAHPFDGGGPKRPIAKMIGFGGAAGGGKSDAMMGTAIIACFSIPGCKVGYFRRKYTQLEGPGGAIMRSHELLANRAKWNGKNRRWTFPRGAFLQFCYLDRDEDCMNYQSQQFDIVLFDEATQFTEYMIRFMLTRLRATTDYGFGTFMGLATNPGNVGHAWFKQQFVDAGDPEIPHVVDVSDELGRPKKEVHVFIPSKLADNAILETRDPEYRKNLENQPEHIRRQMLDGDWEVAEGVAFTEWRKGIHTCDPFHIPEEWIRFRALDWGYAKPFSVGWFAVDFDGRLYQYREYYGWNGKKNEGSKMDPEDVAHKIMELEKGENIRYAVADDSIFGSRQDNSPSIAEQFNMAFGGKGRHWQPVGKGAGSRISGKLELHHRLKWDKTNTGDWTGELPMLVIFNTCKHIIRTLPMLLVDDDNPEDVDSDMEDHAFDQLRYAAMSRPMVPKRKKDEPQSPIKRHKEKLAKQKMRNTHLRVI